ncbi:MAG: butyrate kinase [Sedimentibacter saalensis]|jgi:butyrate kinase|uniref:Probable butyrate kinase n=1 Tax=Sedimentibacter saalensis TaxID=130788 RepID=A0A562JH99_9FIRM|nr:butyrate kinase [Sedimentibacter saalensis]MEA5096562.1 butyrate kinase [Sedimentibacter saalensis]TWH82642.1 butyrate kinase [Sedimentibacter saalensis]
MKQLIINPGSTSTKIAVFEDESLVFEKTLRHSNEELSPYHNVADQFEFRKQLILEALKENDIKVESLNAVVGRGGLLMPIEGGTYAVNDRLIEDLKTNVKGEHASNLGGLIARSIADEVNIPSFIVDPVVVDELDDVARISGHPLFERISIWHALNQKAVARRAAKEKFGKDYNEMNFVVVHLGGGISVGAHKKGRVIDVNNALNGEGPFSPERSGSLPADELVRLCFSGKYTEAEIKKMIVGKGGITAYLGTNNAKEVSERAQSGDEKAKLIYSAMAYQVAKAVGEYAVVLDGEVDAILITGGIAYDKNFVQMIENKVKFIADVIAYPGEDELLALAQGGLRVLNNTESAKEYK